jgi:hypothetical protein
VFVCCSGKHDEGEHPFHAADSTRGSLTPFDRRHPLTVSDKFAVVASNHRERGPAALSP